MPDIDSFRLDPQDCLLLIVDAQERLMSAMRDRRARTGRRAHSDAGRNGDAPRFPRPRHRTIPQRDSDPPSMRWRRKYRISPPSLKMSFSCCGEEAFLPRLHEIGQNEDTAHGCGDARVLLPDGARSAGERLYRSRSGRRALLTLEAELANGAFGSRARRSHSHHHRAGALRFAPRGGHRGFQIPLETDTLSPTPT